MKKMIYAAIIIMLAILGCRAEKEVTIPRSTIQKMVEKKFPIEKDSMIANIRLFAPQVFFVNDSIGIKMKYSAALLIKEVGGTVSFKCKPVYRPENTSFYMSNFELTDITMNNVNSFIGKDQLMSLTSMIVNGLFSDTPLYQLNPNDYKQNMAKMLLKGISVKGDSLVFLVSF
ncbi:MAG TPA: DUF1439 domain-containing protein [Desulfomonilia bacterium]